MKILLVEDDEIIGKGLIYTFEQNGYEVTCKTTVKAVEEFLNSSKPDLIILDITLPDGNGLELYESTISKLNIPTIFLTAKDDENNVVKGLELGAEDYITKPFFVKELLARINKIILREKKNLVVTVKDIKFDIDKMKVYKDNKNVELTSLEIKILHLLFVNINKVVTRNDIIEKIWDWTGNDVNDNTVTVYLKRIREKLKTDIITTVKGIGYRIDEEEN
ncbi:MAG: response regulator transcription factor [Clostridia bacterium]|nr:response regulator transcription factor [Clostridia bacterium]